MYFFKKVVSFQSLLTFSTEQGFKEFRVTTDRLLASPVGDFIGTKKKLPLLNCLQSY